jgi:hypothetical protein
MASRAEAIHEAQEQDWITGEEYARERKRLFDAGIPYPDAPEFHELFARIDARDEFLFETYGRPLMSAHPGDWVAIDLTGSVIVRDTELQALQDGTWEFGGGNFCLRRLSSEPEATLLTPGSD